MIYKISESDYDVEDGEQKYSAYKLSKWMPPSVNTKVLVRVYVAGAKDIHPINDDGFSDPYLLVKLGDQVRNERENHLDKNLNPRFGK